MLLSIAAPATHGSVVKNGAGVLVAGCYMGRDPAALAVLAAVFARVAAFAAVVLVGIESDIKMGKCRDKRLGILVSKKK